MMLDIVLKMVIQDVDSRSELSTRKYKPMMLPDDKVEVDWASFVFSSLLDNVRRAHSRATKRTFKVHYGIMINYLLEQKNCQLWIEVRS